MSGRRSSGQGQSSLGYLFGNSGESLDQPDKDQSKVSSPSVCTSGGGQSSLGYLFGSNSLDQQSSHESKHTSPPVCVPPYGTDDVEEELPKKPLVSKKSYVHHNKVDADNSKDNYHLTGRPSTRVTSVPGGVSSVGYLFGDKR
ncbi:hypothetical protein R6Q59_011193 [Mikania micrantha]|uniref:Uncharacterized protein n=1 Tax=Mikania micrantha TaxID=192012 RepID=A0A5N6N2Z7_9ASTR|nr:hypothetical protein E3N88_24827 [Mikania micrantha]